VHWVLFLGEADDSALAASHALQDLGIHEAWEETPGGGVDLGAVLARFADDLTQPAMRRVCIGEDFERTSHATRNAGEYLLLCDDMSPARARCCEPLQVIGGSIA
jgi:hypothetical protein